MRFPYVVYQVYQTSAFPDRTETKRPALNLRLRKNGISVPTVGIVDSGADDCVFPLSLAHRLGIVLPNQRSYGFSAAADTSQRAFFDVIQVDIWDETRDAPAFTFDLDAGFTSALDQVGFGLLGQNGFFSQFRVTLDHHNNFFELAPLFKPLIPKPAPVSLDSIS